MQREILKYKILGVLDTIAAIATESHLAWLCTSSRLELSGFCTSVNSIARVTIPHQNIETNLQTSFHYLYFRYGGKAELNNLRIIKDSSLALTSDVSIATHH